MDSQFINDGKELGYKPGEEMREYVFKCKEEQRLAKEREREEMKAAEDVRREEREHEKEMKELDLIIATINAAAPETFAYNVVLSEAMSSQQKGFANSSGATSEILPETKQQPDDVDASKIVRAETVEGRPVNVSTQTLADDEFYNMNHKRRGDCIIFSHDKYDSKLGPRDMSPDDAQRCRETFQKLGFEVQIHTNLKEKELLDKLQEVSERDHSDCDALVIVFMSHGGNDEGLEYLCAYDDKFRTTKLWELFTGDKCPTLAGKPKLFFIQACRGVKTDKGVGLRVTTDSTADKEKEYVLPAHADFLIMWGSFEGLPAFNQSGSDINESVINGSVFLHFLSLALKEEGTSTPLMDILIKVTRRVALDFDVVVQGHEHQWNKQVPNISSTLTRKLLFTQPSKK
ncbi:caspase-1 isoform X3 [Hyalella azteca]|uniref:Caspase-1 isoform X3 n=1 Tax=Hyalella azteca TaxID=294128 RepID=A0A979FYB5_HYAAZ|nr:caspase-1 isoform X3 [Hyalella azteca]